MQTTSKNYAVVGSGFSGVFCALALLKRGYSVRMLDIGVRAAVSHASQIQNAIENNAWASLSQMVTSYSKKQSASLAGINFKLKFGDSFVYDPPNSANNVFNSQVHLMNSVAVGGFSQIWGACVSRLTEENVQDWPLSLSELNKYYSKLAELFPLFVNEDVPGSELKHKKIPCSTSSQIANILSNLSKRSHLQDRKELPFGIETSNIALNPQYSSECKPCGLCLHGCSFDVFLTAEHILYSLLKNYPQQFSYSANFSVQTVQDANGKVVLRGIEANEVKEIFFDKVFLASGFLGTAKIVVSSFDLYNESLRFADSRHFILPSLTKAAAQTHEGLSQQPTFAKLFFEIQKLKNSCGSVHTQFYDYNDMMKRAFDNATHSLLPSKWLEPLTNRFSAFLGYLDSRDSNAGFLRFKGPRDRVFLEVEEIKNPRQKLLVHELQTVLRASLPELGIRLLPGAARVCALGEGYHSGGTFPMSANPTSFQTDTLGRLECSKNIHIVDSSVLPTIPSNTLAYTLMANAYRIGDLVE